MLAACRARFAYTWAYCALTGLSIFILCIVSLHITIAPASPSPAITPNLHIHVVTQLTQPTPSAVASLAIKHKVKSLIKKGMQWWEMPVPSEHAAHIAAPLLSPVRQCRVGEKPPFDTHNASLLQNLNASWYYNTADVSAPHFYRRFAVHNHVCALRAFSRQEALTCLANKHIVIIGDSISRYHYQSLTWFLHTGRWPAPMGGSPTAPSPVWEGEHANWTQFLISGSNALNGSERCDCWHGSGANASKTTENRFYNTRTSSGQAVNVSFIGYWASARGHTPLGWAPNTQLNASTYGWREFDWQGDLIDVANVLLAAFGRVDAVVLNTGWWKVLVNSVPRALAQLSALESIVKDKQGMIWATTTPALIPSKANAPRDGLFGAPYIAAQKLGWRVLDRHGLIERLRAHLSEVQLPLEFGWADPLHFRPFVYEASNQLLLSMLCEDTKR